MIRQLGLPTWFGSLSSADTKWKDFLRILAKLNDAIEYSDEELENMDWNTKTKLVQKDPVTCSGFFDYRDKINSLNELDNIADFTFEEFLTNILEVSEEEYTKCVRSSLNGPKGFLKRMPSWKASHDLKFVLDPYASAMYIVSYINKSQKGMSSLLEQAKKEAREGNLELKRQMYQTVYRTVNSKAKQYEQNAEELDKVLEQAQLENNQYDNLAPGTQKVECEDLEEGATESEQYMHFNPEPNIKMRNMRANSLSRHNETHRTITRHHNWVYPICKRLNKGKTSATMYFDGFFQNSNHHTIRFVSFSPEKLESFQLAHTMKSPIKITNPKVTPKRRTTELTVQRSSNSEDCKKLDFTFKQLVPEISPDVKQIELTEPSKKEDIETKNEVQIKGKLNLVHITSTKKCLQCHKVFDNDFITSQQFTMTIRCQNCKSTQRITDLSTKRLAKIKLTDQHDQNHNIIIFHDVLTHYCQSKEIDNKTDDELVDYMLDLNTITLMMSSDATEVRYPLNINLQSTVLNI
ncbi:unnamed protein product [Mytilus coruscus]|uniref:Uncharacterized protein n=1 Tax=Mytilus coruscus TaxID=42192 RepID=A0A6J8F1W3_MYTCO|nr:unnamed protein product [Mytilus coruscus]